MARQTTKILAVAVLVIFLLSTLGVGVLYFFGNRQQHEQQQQAEAQRQQQLQEFLDSQTGAASSTGSMDPGLPAMGETAVEELGSGATISATTASGETVTLGADDVNITVTPAADSEAPTDAVTVEVATGA